MSNMRHLILSLAFTLSACGGSAPVAQPAPPTPGLLASPSGQGSFYTGLCEVRVVSFTSSPVVAYEPVGPVLAGYHPVVVTMADGEVLTGTLLFAAPVVTIYVVP